jgi:hypothetical protein
VPELSGAFDNDEFWQRLLLQATHHEPAIRHAAVAVGALHERFENSVDANLTFKLNEKKTQDAFALQQYSKAIKALLGPQEVQGKQAADVPLMTCVLFIYFEVSPFIAPLRKKLLMSQTLRGHHAAAISHINGGIKILSELHSQSSTNSTPPISTTSYVQMPTLNMLFIRFDTQASFMLSGRQPQLLSPTLDDPAAGYNAEIPETFTSLEEARNALDHIRANEYRRMESVDRRDRAQVSLMLELVRSVALIKLWQWKKAFEDFCKRQTERGRGRATAFQNTVNILKVQKILMEITLGVSQARAMVDECIWDLYTAEFEELTNVAEAVIVGREKSKGGKVERVLCLDVGIVLPLFYVAARCRNRKIRWKAVELMGRTERQEGLWNSVLFAKAAERVIEIEEEGLMLGGDDDGEGTVVPREKRVRGVEAIFEGQDRRARVRYVRHVGAEARDEETIEEWIEW